MGSSTEPERRGVARIVAVAVAVIVVLVGGSVYQSVRVHHRETADESMRPYQPQRYDDGFSPGLVAAHDPADVEERLATEESLSEIFRMSKGDLAYQLYLVRNVTECASLVPCERLSREEWEAERRRERERKERVEARATMREAAPAKRKREMDRAYEEYLAGFPECETFLDGAMLNDPCEPRPLSRKEWERRGKAKEPADAIADDPIRELDGI